VEWSEEVRRFIEEKVKRLELMEAIEEIELKAEKRRLRVDSTSLFLRSLWILTCFQMAFRLSASAISTVYREYPFRKRFFTVVLASFEPGSVTTSFTRTFESKIMFIALYPP